MHPASRERACLNGCFTCWRCFSMRLRASCQRSSWSDQRVGLGGLSIPATWRTDCLLQFPCSMSSLVQMWVMDWLTAETRFSLRHFIYQALLRWLGIHDCSHGSVNAVPCVLHFGPLTCLFLISGQHLEPDLVPEQCREERTGKCRCAPLFLI